MPDHASKTVVPVILCGGSGTRLWPMSREACPKQFLKLTGPETLLQKTVLRGMALSGAPMDKVCIVTLGTFADEAAAQIAALGQDGKCHVLSEPAPRNTAAAIAYAAEFVRDSFGDDAVMWILSSDHHMEDEAALGRALRTVLPAAENGALATFGITPSRPETGYGYIRKGEETAHAGCFRVSAYVEKPNRAVAEQYLASGAYLWNSGMFLFTAGAVLDQFARHAPGVLEGVRKARKGQAVTGVDAALYGAIESTPFDIAIMEKTDRGVVVPCDPRWSDIGGWESLWELRAKDENGVATEGRVVTEAARDCLVISSSGRLVTCAGVSNIAVIDTGDSVLIADLRSSDSLKALVKKMKDQGCAEVAAFLPKTPDHGC